METSSLCALDQRSRSHLSHTLPVVGIYRIFTQLELIRNLRVLASGHGTQEEFSFAISGRGGVLFKFPANRLRPSALQRFSRDLRLAYYLSRIIE
jgi:hypothetical protein